MGAADMVKEIVQDFTGMWWTEGDEGELREAARAWRTFADDAEDCMAACHKKAQDVVDNNKGAGIEAFGAFWKKRHGSGKGYFDDVASAVQDIAVASGGRLSGARGGLRGPGFASRRWPCANRPPGVAALLP
ncbi:MULTISPECIES: hypothetical protein [Streptomyces]|uniref:WXG100-like domain-containing protein n=1 Tax=Streptomyces TaxID=1883 RepID=UPI000B9E8411|nr:hypothetical protein [Streptomyces kasugaensis]